MSEQTAVVADEWDLVALGIAGALAEVGVVTVDATRDARAAVLAARRARVDLLVLGSCRQGSIVEAVREAARLRPRPQIVVLHSGRAGSPDEIGALVAEGVDAVLVRSATGDEVADAIRRLRQGERVVAPAVLSLLLGGQEAPVSVAPVTSVLTARERDVLSGLAQGLTNREIATRLFVGEETVKSHLSRLYTKLDVRDRRDAVARALSTGLLG